MNPKTKKILLVTASITAGALAGLFVMYKIYDKKLTKKFSEQIDEIQKKYDLAKADKNLTQSDY